MLDHSQEKVSLAPVKNYSNHPAGASKIPDCSRMYAHVIIHGDDGNDLSELIHLRCKKWSCPECARINAKLLRYKTKLGLSWAYKEIAEKHKGFKFDYFFKFVTLTLDGEKYRSVTSIEAAEAEIKKNWNKLRSALRKKYGSFEYIWVCESQRDGYPHLHVLIVGKNIAQYGIGAFIKRVWASYGMGFSFIKKVYGGIGGVSAYLTKYMTKELESGRKGSRVFSMSKKLRENCKIQKKRTVTVIEIGYCDIDSETGKRIYRPIKEIDGVSIFELGRDGPDGPMALIADQIGEWFIEQSRGIQTQINFNFQKGLFSND